MGATLSFLGASHWRLLAFVSEDLLRGVMCEWGRAKVMTPNGFLFWRYKLRSLQPAQLLKRPSRVRNHRVRMSTPPPPNLPLYQW
eukprot:2956367-Amphidinium_carterae.1